MLMIWTGKLYCFYPNVLFVHYVFLIDIIHLIHNEWWKEWRIERYSIIKVIAYIWSWVSVYLKICNMIGIKRANYWFQRFLA